MLMSDCMTVGSRCAFLFIEGLHGFHRSRRLASTKRLLSRLERIIKSLDFSVAEAVDRTRRARLQRGFVQSSKRPVRGESLALLHALVDVVPGNLDVVVRVTFRAKFNLGAGNVLSLGSGVGGLVGRAVSVVRAHGLHVVVARFEAFRGFAEFELGERSVRFYFPQSFRFGALCRFWLFLWLGHFSRLDVTESHLRRCCLGSRFSRGVRYLFIRVNKRPGVCFD
mmetsp:Transcript_10763/g.27045  ORF Transcript_10763/g.27045 Transcript_10763/m.27045 type:complete len:224 (-) Transcript_10763:611-1282(-)